MAEPRRLLRRCVGLALPLWLAACGADPEQARLCRSLVAAFEPDARAFEVLPSEAAHAQGYDVKIAFETRDAEGRERPAWIACRFAGVTGGRLSLTGVATERTGRLDEAALFWLETWREIYAREAVDPTADDPDAKQKTTAADQRVVGLASDDGEPWVHRRARNTY